MFLLPCGFSARPQIHTGMYINSGVCDVSLKCRARSLRSIVIYRLLLLIKGICRLRCGFVEGWRVVHRKHHGKRRGVRNDIIATHNGATTPPPLQKLLLGSEDKETVRRDNGSSGITPTRRLLKISRNTPSIAAANLPPFITRSHPLSRARSRSPSSALNLSPPTSSTSPSCLSHSNPSWPLGAPR